MTIAPPNRDLLITGISPRLELETVAHGTAQLSDIFLKEDRANNSGFDPCAKEDFDWQLCGRGERTNAERWHVAVREEEELSSRW